MRHTHAGLGISFELPAAWRFIEIPNGFMATQWPPGAMQLLARAGDEETDYEAIRAEGLERVASSTARDVHSVEDMEHEQADAFYTQRVTSGEETAYIFRFVYRMGDRAYDFSCMVRPVPESAQFADTCLRIGASFRFE